MTRTYIIPMRAPSAPRKAGGQGGRPSFMPKEYRDAQYELRRLILELYGPFCTIEPIKPRPAAPSKGREAVVAWRNVRLDFEALLTGYSAQDEDNTKKWLKDTLGPMSQRHCTKDDLALGWVPLYRNDRQVVGGTNLIYDYQPYNELRFTVTELEAALEPGALHIIQGAHHNESNDEGDGHE